MEGLEEPAVHSRRKLKTKFQCYLSAGQKRKARASWVKLKKIKRFAERAQQVQAFAIKSRDWSSWKVHGGRRESIPASHPLTQHTNPWSMCPNLTQQ